MRGRSGWSSTSCTSALPPASTCVPSSTAMRPVTSDAARCTCTAVQCFRIASPGSTRNSASILRCGSGGSPVTTQLPRGMSRGAGRAPARLSALRRPARQASAGRWWTCRPRTLPAWPVSSRRTASPAATRPEATVPATTRPAPATLKARSTGSRKFPGAPRSDANPASARRWSFRGSTPTPLPAATGNTGAGATSSARNSAAMPADTSWTRSAGTRSIFVSATAAIGTCSSASTARCSSVCGIGPSSAATTSRARSIAWMPASMLRTKRSWPGTSTNADRQPRRGPPAGRRSPGR